MAQPVLGLWRSVTALQIWTAVLGFVGAAGLYALGHPWLGRRRALYLALVLVLSPIWASLAASFMSDVPAFALTAVALALLSRKRPAALAGAIAVSLLAIAVRQTLATLLLVCIAVVVVRWRRPGLVVAIGMAGSSAAFYVWRVHLPHAGMVMATPNLSSIRGAGGDAFGLLLSIGALSIPVIPLLKPVSVIRSGWATGWGRLLVAAGVVAWAVAVRVVGHGAAGALSGNYLDPAGSYHQPLISGAAARVVPAGVWDVVLALAALVAWVLTVRVIELLLNWRALPAPLLPVFFFVVTYAAAIGVTRAFGIYPWDRNLLPLLGPLWVLLVWGTPVSRAGLSVARAAPVLGLWLLVSLVWWVDSGLFDATRWQAAQRVGAATGIPADRIDGGFEWVGWHAPYLGVHSQADATKYSRYLNPVTTCAAVVANGQDPVVARYSWLWVHNRFSFEPTPCGPAG